MNIFLQILQAIKIVNDNIVALSENVNDLSRKTDELYSMMSGTTEPNASGTDTASSTIGSTTPIQ